MKGQTRVRNVPYHDNVVPEARLSLAVLGISRGARLKVKRNLLEFGVQAPPRLPAQRAAYTLQLAHLKHHDPDISCL